jgi:hypothetical protein
MSTPRRDPIVSRRAALAGLGAGGLGVTLGATHSVAAQADAERATHPIVGAWFIQNEPLDSAEVNYAIFHADGTYTDIHSIAGPGIGVWQATGERTVALTFKAINTSFEAGNYRAGTVTVRGSYDVDADGQRFAGTYSVTITNPTGLDLGGFTSTTSAARLMVETDPTSGTPEAGMPTS